MLNVIKFLKFYSLEALASKFGIIVNRHPRYPNLVHLKYNQIESPMDNPIVQECRGLILDEANNWDVIAFPYTKFFNYGEGNAAKIDWSTARVLTKEDGSLMTLYYYANEWHVSTSGTADAGGRVNYGDITFAELFWKVWKDLNYELPFLRNRCFMFELLTPHNRVVVPQHKNRLVLHGMRRLDIEGYPECKPEENGYNWEVIKSFNFGSFDDVLENCQELNPLESEGYVVVDKDFKRIKVKGVKYVALHQMKSSASPKNVLDLVRRNEGDEFLAYFPEFKDCYYDILNRYNELVDKISKVWSEDKDIESQKDFALSIIHKLGQGVGTGVLFSLRKGTCKSVQDGLLNCSLDNLGEALKISDITFSGDSL